MDNPVWLALPAAPRAEAGEVHVVAASLDGASIDELATLSADELARAARFVVEPPRRQYLASRATLRRLLSAFTGMPAAELRFGYGERGKPYLVGVAGLSFNLSHSAEVVLVALAVGREVGVDVEVSKAPGDTLAVARSVFSPGEMTSLVGLPEEALTERFLTYWTRKEAYSKGLGLGLAMKFREVDVRSGQVGGWRMEDLRLGGYLAAVAAEGDGWLVRRWRLAGPD